MGDNESRRRDDARWTEHPSGLAVLSYGLGTRGESAEGGPPPPRSASHRLTDAEREVAKLLLSGASNAEIAGLRCVSEPTVAKQVSACLRKLGVGSRYELATHHLE